MPQAKSAFIAFNGKNRAFRGKTNSEYNYCIISNIMANSKNGDAKVRFGSSGGARLFTVSQAAEYLGTTVATLYSKIWRREIPFIKMGRSVRFDVVDLEELIERSKVKPRELSESSPADRG